MDRQFGGAAEPPPAGGTHTDAELVAMVAMLCERVEQLECQLRETVKRLDAATTSSGAGPTPVPRRGEVERAEPPDAPVPTTDRRHLLARAASVTVGAIAGGTALSVVQASPAAAAPGVFDGNPAVSATATGAGANAVVATATNAFAVSGTVTSGTGVRGFSGPNGTGVQGLNSGSGAAINGSSSSGHGVIGSGRVGVLGIGGETGIQAVCPSGVAIRALSATNNVHLELAGNDSMPPPPGNAVARIQGQIILDQNEDLWLCVVSGTPGVWRRLGGFNTAGAFTALGIPVRVYDSRPGFPPNGGTKAPLAPGTPRSCDLKANSSGIPAGATAVLVSLVATATTNPSGGFLAIYRNGIAWPGTSNLNWSGPNQNVAATTLTAVNATAIANLYASQTTDVVVDVLGYYR